MASKITDYPAKTTFNDGDLYDVSTFNGVTYASEKMTFLQLKTQLNTALTFTNIYNTDSSLTSARTVTLSAANTLNFDGGLTTFKGQDATTSNFAIKAQNSASTDLFAVRNDGKVGVGTTSPSLKFHVNSTAANDGIRITSTSGTKFELENTGAGDTLQFFHAAGSGIGWKTTNNYSYAFVRRLGSTVDANQQKIVFNPNESGYMQLKTLTNATATTTTSNSLYFRYTSSYWNGVGRTELNSDIRKFQVNTSGDNYLDIDGSVRINKTDATVNNVEFPFMATENTALVDSGSTGASAAGTITDWIEVTVGGTTGYIKVYDAK